MSLRSDLGRAHGLGSAKDGVRHWWVQRVSAAALIPLSLWFVVALLRRLPAAHAEVVAWIGSPFVTALLIALIAAAFYHAILGLQVIIEDYVHAEATKIVLLVVMRLSLLLGGLIGIIAVLQIFLGTT